MTRSPFPGMDPYLEAHWLDVHGSLIHLTKAALQPQLGDDLVARTEERIVVEDPTGTSRLIGPDVRVIESGSPRNVVQTAGGIAVAEPIVFQLESEQVRQRLIEILDLTTGGRVITVIEFVSPSNKLPGDGLLKYKQKQQECRDAGVSLVEIDLTRYGRRELLAHRWIGARQYESTYQASVWRAAQPSCCGLYRLNLRERLPAIRVPLRSNDPDAALDLQSLVDFVYASSRYDRTTDYRDPCDPPLSGDDAAWADELLKSAGRR
jgi:hypothetical protein